MEDPDPPPRILWLLRHAKTQSDPPPGGSDYDRRLTPRGRRDAKALGKRMARRGNDGGLAEVPADIPHPAVALVSPAARTSETAELVLGRMAVPPELRFVDALYGAGPGEVLRLLRELPDESGAAMVVGHNPTAEMLSQALLAPDDDDSRGRAARHGFPTCALGVYRFADVTRWRHIGPGAATLVALTAPPY